MTDPNITAENLVLNPSFKKWVLSNGREEKHWEIWCRGNAQYKDEIEEAKQIVRSLSSHDHKVDRAMIDEEWLKLDRQIEKEITTSRKPKSKKINISRLYYISIAASIALLTGVFFFMENEGNTDNEKAATLLQKSTPSGQKLTVRLDDGTVVKMNSESRISYKENFEEDKREVFLEGEAYFEVAHDESRPFLIHTGNIFTKVLGTSFNVRAYPDDEKIQVVVKSGKVSVEKTDDVRKGEKAILLPMEMVTYHQSGKMVKEEVDDPAYYLSWKENIIYLHNARWQEIEATLERWYGKKINVSGTPELGKGYTGTFKDLSLESVLDRMSYSLNFEYEFDKNKEDVFIMFNN